MHHAKAFLQRRQRAVGIGDALDGQDVRAIMADGQGQAGIFAPSVEQDGAGAALAAVTAFLGAGEVESFAQQVEQGDAGIVQDQMVLDTVDGERD